MQNFPFGEEECSEEEIRALMMDLRNSAAEVAAEEECSLNTFDLLTTALATAFYAAVSNGINADMLHLAAYYVPLAISLAEREADNAN